VILAVLGTTEDDQSLARLQALVEEQAALRRMAMLVPSDAALVVVDDQHCLPRHRPIVAAGRLRGNTR
jgi:hypothetical protein